MGKDSELVPRNQALSQAKQDVRQYERGGDVADIVEDGRRQILSERIEGLKTLEAMAQTDRIYEQADQSMYRHGQTTDEFLSRNGLRADLQDEYERDIIQLRREHAQAIHGIAKTGVVAIAEIVAQPVYRPKERRRGLFG